VKDLPENLGEALTGDKAHTSGFIAKMNMKDDPLPILRERLQLSIKPKRVAETYMKRWPIGSVAQSAIQAAIDAGDLDPGRLYSFEKLQAELAHDRRRQDPLLAQEHKKLWASRHKTSKAWIKQKRRMPDE
jgi:hypothetical protein